MAIGQVVPIGVRGIEAPVIPCDSYQTVGLNPNMRSKLVHPVALGVIVDANGRAPRQSGVGGAAECYIAMASSVCALIYVAIPSAIVPHGVYRIGVVGRDGDARIMKYAEEGAVLAPSYR